MFIILPTVSITLYRHVLLTPLSLPAQPPLSILKTITFSLPSRFSSRLFQTFPIAAISLVTLCVSSYLSFFCFSVLASLVFIILPVLHIISPCHLHTSSLHPRSTIRINYPKYCVLPSLPTFPFLAPSFPRFLVPIRPHNHPY